MSNLTWDRIGGPHMNRSDRHAHSDSDGHATHHRDESRAAVIAAPPEALPPGTIWTCPMHPEIRQDRPGACPICGMALEPEIATAIAGPSAELVAMTRRFGISLALA